MLEFKTVDQQAEIISEGTHRLADLIPRFLNAVRDHAPDEYAAMTVSPFGPIPSYVQDEGDDSEWWDSDDASALLEELTEILEDHAPDGYTFGTQDGDGACFGFWPQGPEEGDYVVMQAGHGWSWCEVGNPATRSAIMDENACCHEIAADMDRQRFWPNIWLDHGERGDYSLIVIHDTEKEEAPSWTRHEQITEVAECYADIPAIAAALERFKYVGGPEDVAEALREHAGLEVTEDDNSYGWLVKLPERAE